MQNDLREQAVKAEKYVYKFKYMTFTLFCNLMDGNNMGKLFIQNIILQEQIANLLKSLFKAGARSSTSSTRRR